MPRKNGTAGLQKKHGNRENFLNFLLVFVIVDLFLFPYIRPLRSLTSMLVVAVAFVLRFKIIEKRSRKEFFCLMISLFFIIVSICVGCFTQPETVPATFSTEPINVLGYAVTYSVIYIFVFLYYLYFRNEESGKTALMYTMLKLMLFVIFAFSVFYMISNSGFYAIRPFWTMSGRDSGLTSAYRYTFSFSDPNNIGSLTLAMMILIIENKKEVFSVKALTVVQSGIIVLMTMSSQCIVSMLLYLLMKLLDVIFIQHMEVRIKKRNVLLFVAAILLIGLVLVVISDNETLLRALNRVSGNESSMAVRFRVWDTLLSEKGLLPYLLFGRGNAVINNNTALMTHNGHLYIIYAYGAVAYLLFLYTFFWRKNGLGWSDLFFEIPLFICFSVNIGLNDARYSFAMAFIIALGIRLKLSEREEASVKRKL